VVALKPANTITGWLSSVNRVALKRENTHKWNTSQYSRIRAGIILRDGVATGT